MKSMMIEPERGRVLVELESSEFGAIPVPEKSYDSVPSGKIIAVNDRDEEYKYLVGRIGYWRPFMDELRVATLPTGEKLALIRINDIEGTQVESD